MLQDTSFAIHPGKKETIENSDFIEIGKLLDYEINGSTFSGICENGQLKIQFIKEDIVRIVMDPFGKLSDKQNKSIVLKPQNISVAIEKTDDLISLKSEKLKVEISVINTRISIFDETGRLLVSESSKGMGYKNTGEIICYKNMDEDDCFYGFGEKTGFLNKRGEKLTMWNSDVYAPHNPETDPLYQSIPFFITLRNGFGHGIFFDNPSRTVFDLRTDENHYSFQAEANILDYYVLAGPTMKEVIAQYTELTGRAPIPPKWSLGYHQSRYSYETEEEVLELVKNFVEKEIPLDVIHLDIHYMNGYRVFTFDKDRFPNPKKLITALKEYGIKVVPIVDPGVKEDPEYYVYKEGIQGGMFCKYMEGNVYFGDVWPGNSAFPDFTKEEARKWWGEKHEFYSELGIEGIWNDMNEPAVFNETKTMDVKVIHENDGDPKTHREVHNLYGFMMAEATYEGMKQLLNGKRPFLLTRAGYSGVQRYAAVWTGDNRSFWEHLQMSLPMVMNLGLSGISFAGPDIGGFAHDSSGELLTRWTQAAALSPFFRNHSAIGTARQEPWAFGEKYEKIIKKYIELRYQWMPQLYSLFAEAHFTGTPVMRPLVLEYPNDPKTYNLYDQYMVGDNVIVAPILTPSNPVRAIYLPEGRWVNYWTDEVLEGNQYHLITAELDVLPIFIKEGSAVTHVPVKRNAAQKDTKLTIHLYSSSDSSYQFTIYEDDGETFEYVNGNYVKKQFLVEWKNHEVHLSVKDEGNYVPTWETIEFVIHNGKNNKFFYNEQEMIPSNDGKYEVILMKE